MSKVASRREGQASRPKLAFCCGVFRGWRGRKDLTWATLLAPSGVRPGDPGGGTFADGAQPVVLLRALGRPLWL